MFTVTATDVAGNTSGKSAAYEVNVGIDYKAGSENFNAYTYTGDPFYNSLNGRNELPSGLVVTIKDDASWRASSLMDRHLFLGTTTGGGVTAELSFNGPVKTVSFTYGNASAYVRATIKVVDTNGNVIHTAYGVYSNTSDGSYTSSSFSYTAPPGVDIAYVDFIQPASAMYAYIDNVSWSGLTSRMLMSAAEETVDNHQTDVDDWNLTDSDESQPQTQYDAAQHQLIVTHAEQPMNFNTLAESNATVITVDMANGEANVLNISLGDILAYGEEHAFTGDDTRQLMIKGDAGDVVNLTDLLPDGTDPGNWAKAEGTVTVGGVQYEVYQHSGADTELLVQLGVQTNLNNH